MDYAPVFPPYAHQVTASSLMRDHPSFGLLMGMRTGKTKVQIDEWGERFCFGASRDLLVVAPAGAYKTWAGEIKKHLPPEIYERALVGTWESGADVKLLDPVMRSTDPKRPRALLVNVEALSTVEKAREVCREFLSDNEAIFCVDESTTIKNPKSLRTRAAVALAPLAQRRRILSGLPTPRSPLDLFSQFWFLSPQILGYANYQQFEARYAVKRAIRVGGRMIRIVVGYKNVEELNDLIKPYSYRVRLEDCYDVPPKAYLPRYVKLTDEQQRLYKELKNFATTKLSSGEHVTATEVVVQMLRLHQLCCGHLVDEDGTVHDVKSRRLDDLVDILEEYDGKAVVWCSYRRDVEKITAKLRKMYGDAAVARFYGDNVKDREADSSRFESDGACRYMVATPGSGGRGRTWSVAGLLVYYSNTDNLEHRDQSEERASGVGKMDRVTVVDMMAQGTVEEKIVHALRHKIDMAATIMGDEWREWLV